MTFDTYRLTEDSSSCINRGITAYSHEEALAADIARDEKYVAEHPYQPHLYRDGQRVVVVRTDFAARNGVQVFTLAERPTPRLSIQKGI